MPGGDPDKAFTITIGMDSMADHIGHGDMLSTCEFANFGANSRSMAGRDEAGSMSDPNADARTVGRDTPISQSIGVSAAPAATTGLQRSPMRSQRGTRVQKQR
jgi:hypothetical protein